MSVREEARGKWPQILQALGVDPDWLSGTHSPCPVCGGTKPFRFDDKEGRGTNFCTHHRAADGVGLVKLMFKCDDLEALRIVADALELPDLRQYEPRFNPVVDQEDYEKNAASIRKVWNSSVPLSLGDLGYRYLQGRGLILPTFPQELRFHPGLDFYDQGMEKRGRFATMIGVVRASDGTPITLHRTYLTKEGKKVLLLDHKTKEPLSAKKLMKKAKPLKGGCVQLFPAATVMGIAEGIETALGVTEHTGIPCWAGISATNLPNVRFPEIVRKVIIFADNDKPDRRGRCAGQEASQLLAENLRNLGLEVEIRIPAIAGTDFLDEYLASVHVNGEWPREAMDKAVGNRILTPVWPCSSATLGNHDYDGSKPAHPRVTQTASSLRDQAIAA